MIDYKKGDLAIQQLIQRDDFMELSRKACLKARMETSWYMQKRFNERKGKIDKYIDKPS